MLATPGNGDAPLLKPRAQLIQIDGFPGRVHIEDTLDENHPSPGFQNMATESLIKSLWLVTQGIQTLAGLGESRIVGFNQAISPHREFRIVGQFPFVVVAGPVLAEVSRADRFLERLPIRGILMREFQKDGKVDLCRRKLAAERKVATWHAFSLVRQELRGHSELTRSAGFPARAEQYESPGKTIQHPFRHPSTSSGTGLNGLVPELVGP